MIGARQIHPCLLIYVVFFVIFYPAIFYLRIHHIENATRLIIPLFVFIVFIFVVVSVKTDKRRDFILYLVFLFIFIGDCIINWSTHKELSIIPFSLTHLLLGLYYLLDTRFKRKDFLFLIPLLLFSALLCLIVYKDIKNAFLLSAFMLYINILNFMLWRALCYLRTEQNRLRR